MPNAILNVVPIQVERRPRRRKSVLLAAVLTHDEGRTRIDCTIQDISETGVCIAVSRGGPLPEQFHVINVPGRVAYAVQLVWQRDGEAGAAITRTLQLTGAPDPALAFLKRIWMERALR